MIRVFVQQLLLNFGKVFSRRIRHMSSTETLLNTIKKIPVGLIFSNPIETCLLTSMDTTR